MVFIHLMKNLNFNPTVDGDVLTLQVPAYREDMLPEGENDVERYPDVAEEVMETIRAAERAEAAYERKMYRYKAQYSLDCENGIENAVLLKPQTPEMLLEEKQFQEQVYAAVMKLPEKQAKRIYARYYLGMTVNEIAEVEGVDYLLFISGRFRHFSERSCGQISSGQNPDRAIRCCQYYFDHPDLSSSIKHRTLCHFH